MHSVSCAGDALANALAEAAGVSQETSSSADRPMVGDSMKEVPTRRDES